MLLGDLVQLQVFNRIIISIHTLFDYFFSLLTGLILIKQHIKTEVQWVSSATVSAMMANVERAPKKKYNYVDILPDCLITSQDNLGKPSLYLHLQMNNFFQHINFYLQSN